MCSVLVPINCTHQANTFDGVSIDFACFITLAHSIFSLLLLSCLIPKMCSFASSSPISLSSSFSYTVLATPRLVHFSIVTLWDLSHFEELQIFNCFNSFSPFGFLFNSLHFAFFTFLSVSFSSFNYHPSGLSPVPHSHVDFIFFLSLKSLTFPPPSFGLLPSPMSIFQLYTSLPSCLVSQLVDPCSRLNEGEI